MTARTEGTPPGDPLPDAGPVDVADSYLRRLRGLLGRVRVPRPLLLTPCSSVHGMGMVIPLDVALLDDAGRVIHVTTLWPGGLVRPRRGAHQALETARGELSRLGITRGCVLSVVEGR